MTEEQKNHSEEVRLPTSESQKLDASMDSFPIIGIGASAGGLQALEAFFDNMPSDNGMAFVIVQHPDPNHESILADLLQHRTAMPVFQVMDGAKVQPNHVYVIPQSGPCALSWHAAFD